MLNRRRSSNKLEIFPGIEEPTESSPLLPASPVDLMQQTALSPILVSSTERFRYEDYTTIDWVGDIVRENQRLRRVKQTSNFGRKYFDAIQAWVVLSAVGILCGLMAASIDFILPFLEDIRSGYCVSSPFIAPRHTCPKGDWIAFEGATLFLVYTLLSTILALTSYFVVSRGPSRVNWATPEIINYDAAGSGIPEVKVILGGFILRGMLGFKTLVLKYVSLILCISSGMMLGTQGPLVHMSCAIGNITTRVFNKYSLNAAKRREILSSSAAAGVAIAFGAPLGGVLFSLEELSYYFPPKTLWRAFFTALAAATSLKILNPFNTGKLVLFQVTYDQDWIFIELIPFMLLGVFGGLFGSLFIKLAGKLRWFKSNLLHVLAISLITSLLSVPFEVTRLSNITLVSQLFSECPEISIPANATLFCNADNQSAIVLTLIYALLSKSLLMILTFGTALPGAVFIPSMLIGAIGGRIVGTLLSQFSSLNVIPGVYAMVGAAAVLSGVTRMTVSLTVIVFELTGGLRYVLPVMISIMVAKWTADAFVRDSIYDQVILEKGYPYLNFKRSNLLNRGALVTEVMQEVEADLCINTESRYFVDELQSKLQKMAARHPSLDHGFPVIKSATDWTLIGYITQTDLKQSLNLVSPDACLVFSAKSFKYSSVPHLVTIPITAHLGSTLSDLSDWIDKSPILISHSASCEMVVEMFVRLGMRVLLVVNEGKFIGEVHKKRLLIFLREIQTDEERRDERP